MMYYFRLHMNMFGFPNIGEQKMHKKEFASVCVSEKINNVNNECINTKTLYNSPVVSIDTHNF